MTEKHSMSSDSFELSEPLFVESGRSELNLVLRRRNVGLCS